MFCSRRPCDVAVMSEDLYYCSITVMQCALCLHGIASPSVLQDIVSAGTFVTSYGKLQFISWN